MSKALSSIPRRGKKSSMVQRGMREKKMVRNKITQEGKVQIIQCLVSYGEDFGLCLRVKPLGKD
jgi:thiamine monophosphate kinase